MYKTLTAAAAVALWGSAATAASGDFDFNFDTTDSAADMTMHGEAFTAFDFGSGLTGSVSVVNNRPNTDGEARIFDPDTKTDINGDNDLLNTFTNANNPNDKRDFGNALIIQEGGNANTPDDEGQGGSITFIFDQAIDLLGLIYLDGEKGASVWANMQEVGAAAAGVAEDNEFQIIDLSGSSETLGITRFEVVFNGSGAIGELDIQVSAVPLPASLGFLMAGLGGLGLLRRKRNAA